MGPARLAFGHGGRVRAVTSIDRTAYPRFRRSVPIKELQESFTPSGPEIEWARERTRTPEHLLALLLLLKAFQRLGCFPDLFEVPLPVVDHIRGVLGLASSVVGEHASSRTGERQRGWARERLRVVFDPPAAEQLARQVISEAALSKDNPADLINVALEQLVAHRFELPGYTTLDELATAVRREVNDGIYATVYARISEQDRVVLTGLLRVDPVTRRSLFDELKRTAAAATVSRFREHVAHLTWLDGLGTTARWMAEVPPAKVSHFAAVARVSNAGDLREMAAVKQIVSIASLLHIARIRGRDDLATMYCKRMASVLALLPFYAGLRISETVALNLDDIKLSARKGLIIVRAGKGQRYREVPAHNELRGELAIWINDERPSWPHTETTEALLLNHHGGRLGTRGAATILADIAADAGLHDDFTTHVLRHTFGTNLVRGGHDLVLVAELMGHTRLETTRGYARPTTADRENAINTLPTDR